MTLNVFGVKVAVKVTDLTSTDYCGLYDPNTEKIYLCSSLKGIELTQVMLHELFHAVIHRNSFNQVISPDSQELLVDILATVLTENFNIKCKTKKK